MKEVKAFIKPIRLEKVVAALRENGFDSVTISESEGTGNYKRQDSKPSLKYHFTDSKIIKVELVCKDNEVDGIVDLICENAQTHYPADGIIYVADVISAYRIKNGESLK